MNKEETITIEKGSRLWAFKMACSGKRLRNSKYWVGCKGHYMILDKEHQQFQFHKNGKQLEGDDNKIIMHKDGWELYEEKPIKQEILKHTLKRDGNAIHGRITEVRWGTYIDYEGDEVKLHRGNCEILWLSKDFCLCTSGMPALRCDCLYIHGSGDEYDKNYICYNFESEERAKEVMELIESITIEE